MSALLKMGVIGLGRMGQLYARILAAQVSGVHLYAVADSNEQAQNRLADELNVPYTFANAHELIAFPELDAVVIATPTSTHYDLVIAAAAAGKASRLSTKWLHTARYLGGMYTVAKTISRSSSRGT